MSPTHTNPNASFPDAVAGLLRRLGAIEDPEATGYPFTLLWTKGAPLHAVPLDTWVHMRFEWPKIAAGRVSGPLNPWSGKFNFHPEKPDEEALRQLERLLSELIVRA